MADDFKFMTILTRALQTMIFILLFTNFKLARDHNASFSIDGVAWSDTVGFAC